MGEPVCNYVRHENREGIKQTDREYNDMMSGEEPSDW